MAYGWEEGDQEMGRLGVWIVENILKFSGDECTTLKILKNILNCIVKWVNFIACELYINKVVIEKEKKGFGM